LSEIGLAAIQLASEPGDVDGNLDRLVAEVRRIAPSSDLIVAPELALTGYDLDLVAARGRELAEPLDGPSIEILAALAADVDATLVVGVLELLDDALFDTAVVLTPHGRTVGYRKSHLYPPETAVFAAGDELVTVPTPAGLLGPLICFEHAFPEVATTLALAGAQVLAIPSAVPVGYEHLLHVRNRARAQDNQLFVVACNATGHGFCGESMIVAPDGAVLAHAGPEPTTLLARVDLEAIAAERRQEPALAMRREPLYRQPPRRVEG
jgi:predicted amidohydrolase